MNNPELPAYVYGNAAPAADARCDPPASRQARILPFATADERDAGRHPLQGRAMSGAEVVVQTLADEGCATVFGYSGGAILPVYDALFRYNAEHRQEHDPLPLMVGANEQGAGFMAAGYARASGQVGVAVVTSGPGATNLVTPVRDAMADSIPMVAITGQVPTSALGSDAFQEAPISNIMSACAKHVFLVTRAGQLEATLRTAFELARSGRPGPVIVDIPKDVQNAALRFDGACRLPLPGYRARVEAVDKALPDDARCRTLFAALAQARRPLIYAGGGVVMGSAANALRRFAEAFDIPVTTTLMGLGAVDTTSSLAVGMLGMHGAACANYAVEDCDFLFALGARFDDRVAGVAEQFAPNARFLAQIDIDATEVGKVKRVDWHHVGALAPALEKLSEYGEARNLRLSFADWHEHIAELKARHAMDYDRKSPTLQPQAVIEAINRHTQGRAIVATGVGQHQMWAAQYLDFRAPRQWLTSGSMGTMGFGLPAAIGAQLARPDALVIDVDGDGSLRMNIGELETVTSYDLPVKVVMLNNSADGMVRQWQKRYFGGRFAASDKTRCRKDFVKAAEADGFGWAQRVTRKDELDEAIAAFLAQPGPAFLEVVVDGDAEVYPMVGPGKSYAEMVTGPYIAARSSS